MDSINEDNKLVKILEFFLSLHEADEVYNMIFNDKFTPEDVENKLKKFTGWFGENEEEEGE